MKLSRLECTKYQFYTVESIELDDLNMNDDSITSDLFQRALGFRRKIIQVLHSPF